MQTKMAFASKDGSCARRYLLADHNDQFRDIAGMSLYVQTGAAMTCTRHKAGSSRTYLLQTDSYEVLELMAERAFKLRSR